MGEVLIGADDTIGRQGFVLDTGADDINAVEPRLGRDPVGIANITSCAFAVASSPRRPAIAARKLSIARLSGNAAGALAFVEVLKGAFGRGFFRSPSGRRWQI